MIEHEVFFVVYSTGLERTEIYENQTPPLLENGVRLILFVNCEEEMNNGEFIKGDNAERRNKHEGVLGSGDWIRE